MARHTLSPDTLSELRRQLAPLLPRSAERRQRLQAAAANPANTSLPPVVT